MTDRSLRDQLFERVLGVPLVGALVAGIGSFFAGYLTILTLAGTTGDGLDVSNLREELSVIGQFFYNSFQVPTFRSETPAQLEHTEGGETLTIDMVNETLRNDISGSVEVERVARTNGEEILVDGWTGSWTATTETATTFPSVVYFAVPVIALVLAGFLVSYRGVALPDERGTVPLALRSVLAGGLMTVGFLLCALGGMYLFTLEGENIVRYPARIETILWGVAYPLVFGTAGAFAGLLVRENGREPREQTTGETEDDTPSDPEATDDSESR